MEVSPFLPLPAGLMIEAMVETDAMLTILVQATLPTACCPLCHMPSGYIHSFYQRTVADLPCGGRQVTLRLSVRKFYCLNLVCARQIFTERLHGFIQPWAHRTTRLLTALRAIGFATGGEPGARLTPQLGMIVSPSTLLRHMKAAPVPEPRPVTKVGIDDFALRRGRTYGTIIVDLETHRVIDLLPDRSVATAMAWFQAHPEIVLISRDRATDYATAARLGAPQAMQIADRFHLCQNLTDAVQKALARCRADIRKSQQGKQNPTEVAALQAPAHPLLAPDGTPYSAHQRERYDRYHQAMALRAQSLTVKAIAERVGLSRRTIQRWLTVGTYVETRYHQRHRSWFDAYEAYVRRRWDEGEHNIQQLWREIKAQGYPHSDRAFRAHLAAARGPKPADLPAGGVLDHFSAKKAVWLFVRPTLDLLKQEQAELEALRQASPMAETLYQLVQAFFRLLRARHGAQLDGWLAQAAASGIPELLRFAKGLEQDKAAVLAGLSRPESNAITEGQVNRLKLVKRIMFGRARFALLRQRVLFQEGSFGVGTPNAEFATTGSRHHTP